MAKQTSSLDPNAPPYLRLPASRRFYVYLPPQTHPYNAPLSTYNIRLQPSPPKIYPPSLTPVPAGPRIPKSRLRLRLRITKPLPSHDNNNNNNSNHVKWRPRFQATSDDLGFQATSDDLGFQATSDDLGFQATSNDLGFQGKRWKNSRKEYQKSLPLETNTTSLMIKNVPNKYTRTLLIQTLDIHCQVENKKNGESVSAYDFLYLPIDFNRRTNAGFAFVNFTTPEAALRFRDAFSGKRWNRFDSSKVAEISRARIQGRTALMNNCKCMDFSYGSEEDMPVVFAPARDGSDEVCSKMITVGRHLHGRN